MARHRGFTIVELLVALTLTGVAAVAIASAFLTGLRVYSREVIRAQVRAELRTAMAILTSELRVLDAASSTGSDILAMERSTITYRATRSTHFLCMPPDPGSRALTLWASPSPGLRDLEVGRDSLLLLAENDIGEPDDDAWLSVGLIGATRGAFCPGGAAGLRLTLGGVSASDLAGVYRGAAVIGFQVTRILLYSDSQRRYWIGMRELRPDGGWSITQPILGPVTRDGLRLNYFRSDGGSTSNAAAVARITAEIVGVGFVPSGSNAEQLRDSLTIHVAVRNNPRAS